MFRLLLIVGFVASVGINSLAGVNPHLEGDGGCAASCCRAARNVGQESVLSKICCLFDCKQSGESNSASTSQFGAAQKRVFSAAHFIFKSEAFLPIGHATFPNSPTRNIAGSSDRYLETRSLLI